MQPGIHKYSLYRFRIPSDGPCARLFPVEVTHIPLKGFRRSHTLHTNRYTIGIAENEIHMITQAVQRHGVNSRNPEISEHVICHCLYVLIQIAVFINDI